MIRPPITHIPPRQHIPWADDAHPGSGLGWAIAWCVVAAVAVIAGVLIAL